MPLGALFQMEVKADGTGTLGSMMDPEEIQEFAWTIEDGSIKLTTEDDDTAVIGEYDGTYLSLHEEDEDSEIVVMVSVKEFTEFDYDAWLEEMMGAYTD
jgi:hypothetical protein